MSPLKIAFSVADTPSQFNDIASYLAWISGCFGVKSRNPETPSWLLEVGNGKVDVLIGFPDFPSAFK
jgi:hypothetical protein